MFNRTSSSADANPPTAATLEMKNLSLSAPIPLKPATDSTTLGALGEGEEDDAHAHRVQAAPETLQLGGGGGKHGPLADVALDEHEKEEETKVL
jgi:hypothetical protein